MGGYSAILDEKKLAYTEKDGYDEKFIIAAILLRAKNISDPQPHRRRRARGKGA